MKKSSSWGGKKSKSRQKNPCAGKVPGRTASGAGNVFKESDAGKSRIEVSEFVDEEERDPALDGQVLPAKRAELFAQKKGRGSGCPVGRKSLDEC